MIPVPISELQLNDIFNESVLVLAALVILIAMWRFFKTYQKREWLFPTFSMGIFLIGSILDLMDEFFTLPFFLEEVLEGYASVIGIFFFSLGILFILRQLVKSSQTDPLTGLYNRRHFQEMMAKELERAKTTRSQLALAFIDLDRFREINNRFGHTIGDVALLDIALKLKEMIRPGDLLARFGGDEFLVLLPNTDRVQGLKFLEELNQAVMGMRIAGKHRASLSAGLALYPQDGADCEQLMSQASKQMYQNRQDREQRTGQH